MVANTTPFGTQHTKKTRVELHEHIRNASLEYNNLKLLLTDGLTGTPLAAGHRNEAGLTVIKVPLIPTIGRLNDGEVWRETTKRLFCPFRSPFLVAVKLPSCN